MSKLMILHGKLLWKSLNNETAIIFKITNEIYNDISIDSKQLSQKRTQLTLLALNCL